MDRNVTLGADENPNAAAVREIVGALSSFIERNFPLVTAAGGADCEHRLNLTLPDRRVVCITLDMSMQEE